MSYDKKKVTFMPMNAGHIAEIYSSGLQFALASDKHEQACHFVYCKDFFQDAYQGHFHNQSRGIYGFSYNPATNAPLSEKSFNVLVINLNDADFHKKVEGAQDFLTQVEVLLKMKQKTSVYEAEEVPEWAQKKKAKIFLFKTNKRWYASPVMISLYTLLIRVAFLHKKGTPFTDTINGLCRGDIKPYQKNDRGYMTSGAIGLAHILKNGDRKVFGRDVKKNFPKGMDIGTMHNNMGIVAYSSQYCKPTHPDWYKEFEPVAFGAGKEFNFKVKA